MSTTAKVLLAIGGVLGIGGAALAVRHYGRFDVASGTHREWKYRISRKEGMFTVYVAQPGFAEAAVGDYPSKPAALERAITYIDQKVGPGLAAGVDTNGGPVLRAQTAWPAQAGFADQ